uniref:helix-turn-helix domain-containing protein n=1 Tax=Solidesulfovibrio sp. TaxID=2910990 RepID=UPI00262FA5A9
MKEKNEEKPVSDFSSDLASESRKEFEAVTSRMIKAIGGRNPDDLASFLDISKDAIYKAGRTNKIPPAWFLQIGRKKNISIDWLVTGDGSMNRDNVQPSTNPTSIVPKDEPPYMSPEAAPAMGYTLVPKVQARLAAGTGSLETEGQIVGYYAFKTDFLLRKGRAKKMVLMDVAGDSM